ncbi:CU044_5270 family protein [Streptomyces sp. VRA16 Mangrove soil]|uniref:CU044_5270 family protein n=1 Tax=Streptomyces sp. VRA16 Mangrove soil TaxID=2817434 RepID=UPI001A9F78D6|nr:CU044_5270 family protein [Streptomyces sp. VRA16 Mangrove soil]MBO1335291.1 CU044_5270 family protein [Streptomyces sp. VRA16 Mangrove soil]
MKEHVDEMRDVRDFRAGAPAPDRGLLAPGRDRLVAATRAGRGRGLRADWRLAAAGAAAALTAVAVLATGIGESGGGGGADRAKPAATRTVQGTAGEVLERAADTVAGGAPMPTPRVGQWIYTKTLFDAAGGSVKGGTAGEKKKPETRESWLRYADPNFENGKEGDDRSPRERLAFLKALPDDPAAVLRKVRAYYPSGQGNKESEAEHDLRALTVLLESQPMPPAALAKLYRALAAVPGIQVDHHLGRDLAGRDAFVLSVDQGGTTLRRELLIGADTYRFLGERRVVPDTFKQGSEGGDLPPDGMGKPGDVLLQETIVTAAVVDHHGDRS